ncbi:hypothetical protein GLP37_20490 [Photobacterium phosphoreum]|uniref:hypothetical protein n=1 Tax=Photobacterium phosphoreum TaxID=659 RepID=UPI001E42D2D4|nr:hypothetical protein [Photobacterium phosphoreum]MCD9504545.1 hypothetical protein [Photobacterium phosphoreum]
MKETELMKIERITLAKTEYSEDYKTVEFQFVNQSNYCLYSDEDVEVTITKEIAIELIENLKREFDIKDSDQQLAAAKAEIAELVEALSGLKEADVNVLIKGAKHIPTMRARQSALSKASNTLARHKGE